MTGLGNLTERELIQIHDRIPGFPRARETPCPKRSIKICCGACGILKVLEGTSTSVVVITGAKISGGIATPTRAPASLLLSHCCDLFPPTSVHRISLCQYHFESPSNILFSQSTPLLYRLTSYPSQTPFPENLPPRSPLNTSS